MSKSTLLEDRQRAHLQKQLQGRVPEPSLNILINWIVRHQVDFRVSRPRKSKLGDFRGGSAGTTPRITVNANLNPYSFLVTSVHEFAHYLVWDRYGHEVMPHGNEWKNAFGYLLEGFQERGIFPDTLEKAIDDHKRRPHAATCSDPSLLRALEKFDKVPPVYLEEIPRGVAFSIDGRKFLKGEKQRTRFLCQSLDNGRMYHVHGMAKVKAV